VPRKPLELSDWDDPASPTVPALQLELHHPAPRSLLCMDASFCVLRCRVLRKAKIIAGARGALLARVQGFFGASWHDTGNKV
jgi:hypothetical protein